MREAVLELPNQPLFAGAAAAFAGEMARRAGFGETSTEEIQAAVNEACAYVLERSRGESLSYYVGLRLEAHGLTVRVRDQALPLDPDRPADRSITQLGVQLMRALVDEVRFINRGREGNEVVLRKRFKGRIHGMGHELIPPRDTISKELVVRAIEPQEAVGVSRCIYRAYGYTYTGVESIYSPEWVQEMTRQGELISVVGLSEEGAVVGHGALLKTETEGVFELGLAAISPEHRGQGLFQRITEELLNLARNRGIRAVVSQPVCHHPYSQKAIARFGFQECGLFLACIPPMEKVKGEVSTGHRNSLLDTLLLLEPVESRPAYCPEAYRHLWDEMLGRFGQVRDNRRPETEQTIEGRVRYTVYPPMGRAVVRVRGPAQERLKELVRELLAQAIAVIWVELPLDDPATPSNADFLNRNGFFLASLTPGPVRDVLRLQYLSHLEFDPDRIVVASEWARQFKQLVLEDHARRAGDRL